MSADVLLQYLKSFQIALLERHMSDTAAMLFCKYYILSHFNFLSGGALKAYVT